MCQTEEKTSLNNQSSIIENTPKNKSYQHIYNAQRLKIIYSKNVLGMRTSDIAQESGVNYNSIRKIICLFNSANTPNNGTQPTDCD